MHAGEEIRITEPRRGVLVVSLEAREAAKRLGPIEAHHAVIANYRLQCFPDPGLPVDQGAVTVEGQDPVVGQAAHVAEP